MKYIKKTKAAKYERVNTKRKQKRMKTRWILPRECPSHDGMTRINPQNTHLYNCPLDCFIVYIEFNYDLYQDIKCIVRL